MGDSHIMHPNVFLKDNFSGDRIITRGTRKWFVFTSGHSGVTMQKP